MPGKNQFYVFCMHGGDRTKKHTECPAKIYLKGIDGNINNGLKIEEIIREHKGHFKYSQQELSNLLRVSDIPDMLKDKGLGYFLRDLVHLKSGRSFP